jgi:hypothetical protein
MVGDCAAKIRKAFVYQMPPISSTPKQAKMPGGARNMNPQLHGAWPVSQLKNCLVCVRRQKVLEIAD